jgi:hypothetical protein
MFGFFSMLGGVANKEVFEFTSPWQQVEIHF